MNPAHGLQREFYRDAQLFGELCRVFMDEGHGFFYDVFGIRILQNLDITMEVEAKPLIRFLVRSADTFECSHRCQHIEFEMRILGQSFDDACDRVFMLIVDFDELSHGVGTAEDSPRARMILEGRNPELFTALETNQDLQTAAAAPIAPSTNVVAPVTNVRNTTVTAPEIRPRLTVGGDIPASGLIFQP